MEQAVTMVRTRLGRRSGAVVVAMAGLAGGTLLLGRPPATAAPSLVEEATTVAACPVGLSRDGLADVHPALKPYDNGGRNLQASEVVRATELSNPEVTRAVAAGRAPETALAAPTKARRMSATEAERFIPTGLVGMISPERSVWVVTVHAPVKGRSVPGSGRPVADLDVFTAAIDACSGSLIVVGMGERGLDR